MLKRIVALSAATMLAGTANAASFINGSFEDSSVVLPKSFVTLEAGNNQIAGWTVTSGSIDYKRHYWRASDGNFSIDLAGNAIGSIAQTFDTVAGQQYTITFDMSANPDGGTDPRNLLLSIDGGPAHVFMHPGGTRKGDMNWLTQTFQFVAAGISTTISFGADGSSNGFYGTALDNVWIGLAVPEPATWAMLIAGFGMVGAAARRRPRSSTALA